MFAWQVSRILRPCISVLPDSHHCHHCRGNPRESHEEAHTSGGRKERLYHWACNSTFLFLVPGNTEQKRAAILVCASELLRVRQCTRISGFSDRCLYLCRWAVSSQVVSRLGTRVGCWTTSCRRSCTGLEGKRTITAVQLCVIW